MKDVRGRGVSSAFSRKNSSFHSKQNSSTNKSSVTISHRAYTTNEGEKQKVVKELENKFLTGNLPPKTPGLKTKHNFKFSGNKDEMKPAVSVDDLQDFQTLEPKFENDVRLLFIHNKIYS